MGNQILKLSHKVCGKVDFYKVLILGLEGAGKTTLFDRIKSNEVYIRNPTIGFNTEQIKINNMMITLWDFGGHEKIMNLWDKYFDGTDLIILVVDSIDTENFDKLEKIFKMIKENLADVYVMILINKVDLNGSLSTEEIERRSNLYEYGLKIAKIIRTSIVLGQEMREIQKTMCYILKNKIKS